jgi:hypothetical protein
MSEPHSDYIYQTSSSSSSLAKIGEEQYVSLFI